MPNLRRLALAFAVSLFTLGLPAAASAQLGLVVNVDCTRGQSLAGAPALGFPNATVYVKGTCTGPVTLTANGVQLVARGAASISGGGKDAVTVTGAQRVGLTGLTVTGGGNGIVVQGGGRVTLKNVTVTGNGQSGILVQAGSSVALDGGSSSGNGFHGIDVESTSTLAVTGAYVVAGNGVFGLDVNNGSSLALTSATVAVHANTLGVQLGTNASGFMDGASTLDASGNFSVGLTLVSGAHMVDFGGTIVATSNAIHGISLNSRAGLDLDAAAQVTAGGNGTDGVHLEQGSVMTIFNNPQFSQANGTTLLSTVSNGVVGIDLLTGSRILVDNYAALLSSSNQQVGIALDDGSSLAFGQTVPVSGVSTSVAGNPVDVQLTFGSRLTTLGNDTFGTVHCDASGLVRGAAAVSCPR